MISAIHTALSGLTAYAKQFDVSANNMANVNTDGFKKSGTAFIEAQNAGCSPSSRRTAQPIRPCSRTPATARRWPSYRTSIWVKKPSARSLRNEDSKPICAPCKPQTICSEAFWTSKSEGRH